MLVLAKRIKTSLETSTQPYRLERGDSFYDY